MTAPCKGCDRRRQGCHAECEDYLAYKEKVAHINKQRGHMNDLNNYASEVHKQIEKKYSGKGRN